MLQLLITNFRVQPLKRLSEWPGSSLPGAGRQIKTVGTGPVIVAEAEPKVAMAAIWKRPAVEGVTHTGWLGEGKANRL
jgi:hypothetical protein